jgi:NitT/TauT family transport system substrate-binding protein
MKTSKLWLFAALAAALMTAQPAAAQTKLRMLYTTVNGFATAYVAQEQGFFKKRGIDVEFIATNSSGNNPPALVSGSVEIGGPTMPTLLQANDGGLDLVVIAGGGVYPLDGDILVARPESGIEKTTDLKGKKVGVPGLGALLHVMLRKSLKDNGIDPNSVQYVEVSFPQAADALKSGSIDAYPAQSPFTARILQSGAGKAVQNWLQKTPDGTLTVVYATTRDWANKNRQTVTAFRDGMKEAATFIKANTDGANQAISTYTKLPAQLVATIKIPEMSVDVSPEQVKWWIDIAKEQDLIKGNPNPNSILFK